MTTIPKKYAVKPNAGVILPRSTCDVVVTMEKQLEAPPGLHCKDKFMFSECNCDSWGNYGENGSNLHVHLYAIGITLYIFYSAIEDIFQVTEFNKEAGNLIEQYKLNVFYVSPSQNPSPISKASEKRSSPSEKGNMNSYGDTAVSVLGPMDCWIFFPFIFFDLFIPVFGNVI
ncbi:hypothetical protein IFM89_012139 [Coptis chinensis]|uniref:MSP domain-containing protein n=1 Tax=Coptis chinensis TaxID=261450 RepID=A0A835LXS9_9MAGN|nr:hypothetical protein IFM89_012139 [Coptis chinensis]